MHPMQIARRELGLCSSGNQETDYECDGYSYHTQPYPIQTATPIWTSMMRYMMIAKGL